MYFVEITYPTRVGFQSFHVYILLQFVRLLHFTCKPERWENSFSTFHWKVHWNGSITSRETMEIGQVGQPWCFEVSTCQKEPKKGGGEKYIYIYTNTHYILYRYDYIWGDNWQPLLKDIKLVSWRLWSLIYLLFSKLFLYIYIFISTEAPLKRLCVFPWSGPWYLRYPIRPRGPNAVTKLSGKPKVMPRCTRRDSLGGGFEQCRFMVIFKDFPYNSELDKIMTLLKVV